MMVSAIEQSFPSKELSELAELESWRKEVNRPIYHMHKWWATRLGSVLRAVLIGALSDAETDIWKLFYTPVRFPEKVVLDPFMGSGTTVGEALKLGCNVIGTDINPVSVFQVRKALEPVDLIELEHAYRCIEAKVKPEIRQMYQAADPETHMVVDILYCFWVMTVPCLDCETSVDLFDTSIFAKHTYPKKVPAAKSICFRCGQINTCRYDTTHLECAGCGQSYNPQTGVVSQGHATCAHCGKKFKIIDAVQVKGTIPSYRMYALLLLMPDGSKKYVRATREDELKNEYARELLERQALTVPTTPIASGHNTDQILRYNYRQWRHMFNYRQLYCLSLLLQAILEEPNDSCRELLLLLFSGTLEFNNMFCSYKGEGTGAVRHLFHHHILKPERMALENTIWGTPKSSGCFSTLFESRIKPALSYRQNPFELQLVDNGKQSTGKKRYGLSSSIVSSLVGCPGEFGQKRRAFLSCTDSAQLPFADESVDVVVTDPPYFDFVHYSELADFFYAWLRLGLQQKYPEFRPITTRQSGEVQQRNAERFTRALSGVLAECTRVLKPGGLCIFTFHHSRNEGWNAVGEAILHAGLAVVAAHPIKAEMSGAAPKAQSEAPINYDAILVCKRKTESTEASVEDALAIVSTKVREKFLSLSVFDKPSALSKGDLFVITQSEALHVFSMYAGSLRDSCGSVLSLAEFLQVTSNLVIDQSLPAIPYKAQTLSLW